MFENQTFRNQHEDTAEKRAIIKINAEDFCDILAEMTVSGNETCGIQKLTLPITYGRYHSELAKAFAREYAKQGQKFDYLYKCKSDSFQDQMRFIASNYIKKWTFKVWMTMNNQKHSEKQQKPS